MCEGCMGWLFVATLQDNAWFNVIRSIIASRSKGKQKADHFDQYSVWHVSFHTNLMDTENNLRKF